MLIIAITQGCWIDSDTNRDLNGFHPAINTSMMTYEACFTDCANQNFTYAGIQMGFGFFTFYIYAEF